MFQIERGDPDGSNRITMVNGLSHPWGVAVYDSYLYFTDRDFEVIERVDKATGLNRVIMRDNVAGLRVLKVHYRDCEYNNIIVTLWLCSKTYKLPCCLLSSEIKWKNYFKVSR